jgi:hypothetical protein|tara:strand:+ start:143 stop:424 length:282 start_codon:yes stop_codon:yes gene_type:complete
MSEEKGGFFSQIKNQIIATLGVALTTAGTVFLNEIKVALGLGTPEAVEVVAEEQKEPTKDTLVIIQKEQPKVIVKKVEPKKTETEKRKEEFGW